MSFRAHDLQSFDSSFDCQHKISRDKNYNIKRNRYQCKKQSVRLLELLTKKMYKLVFLLLTIGAVISSPSTPVRKCKGVTQDLFKKVVVRTPKGVCTKLPCDLVAGADVKTDITFQVRKEVQKITLKANATTFGVTIDYPIKNAENGCDMLTNTYCPVEPNTEVDLTFVMDVLKIFPKVSVDLVIYMLDQKNTMISCFEVSTKVVDGK